MKPGIQLLIAIVVGFTIGGLMCRPDRTGEAAQRRADSLAVIVDALTVRDRARAIADAAADDTIAALRATNQRLGQRVASTSVFSDSLMRELRTWADSMVPKRLVLAVMDSTQATIQLQAQQIAALERASAIADRQRVSADSAADAWRQVALGLQGELAAALKRGNRRWGCTGGVGATAGISQYAAGLGFTCGRFF